MSPPARCSGDMYAGVPPVRVRSTRAIRDAREPEVGDARAAVGADQDVVGLEVAVHEAGGVRRDEAVAGRGVRAR